MTASTDHTASTEASAAAFDDTLGVPTTYTLRRTGRKAVRFDGWQLVEAVGPGGDRSVWHDLSIYRTIKGGIVVELIVRRKSLDQQDVFLVNTFDDLYGAAAWLEAYRPTDHAPVPTGLAAADAALPWAVLQAVHLRQSIERIEMDYSALLSEVFAALDLTDPAEAGTPRTGAEVAA